MIDVLPYVSVLNWQEVEEYAGMKFYREECRGEECRRDRHPIDAAKLNNGKCSYYEEKLISDEMIFQIKGAYGKIEDKHFWVPIRWWNFTWSVHEVKKHFPTLKDQLNCFDISNHPDNKAREFGYPSYSKFLEFLSEKT